MTNTVLIEQAAKNIKLAEAIVLTALFGSIAAGRGGMYLSLARGGDYAYACNWSRLLFGEVSYINYERRLLKIGLDTLGQKRPPLGYHPA